MASGSLFNVEGRSLKRLFMNAVSNTRPEIVMRVIGKDLLTWVIINFQRQGGLDGSKKWAPMSPSTRAGRRKGPGTGGAKLLQDTGRLRQSYVEGERQNVFDVRKYEVTVGTVNEVAAFHEEGTGRYWIEPVRKKALRFMTKDGYAFSTGHWHPGLPARPMLPSQRVATKVMKRSLGMIIEEAAKGRGPRGRD